MINQQQITVGTFVVDVVRKDIKNVHLGVYPPSGRVRVAAPIRLSMNAIRMAVVTRMGWIRRKQTEFARQAREPAREMVSGETHYFRGRKYRLRVVESPGPTMVRLRAGRIMELRVPHGTSISKRAAVLQRWYREKLRRHLDDLVAKWEPVIKVGARGYGIRRMKTRWGSCSREFGRIWLNLELAKKPLICAEYVLVHELVHLLERHHGERFVALMDKHYPAWRAARATLNAAPLSNESWLY